MTAVPLPLVVVAIDTERRGVIPAGGQITPTRTTVNGYVSDVDVTLAFAADEGPVLLDGHEPLFPTEVWVNGDLVTKTPGRLMRQNPESTRPVLP